MTQKLPQRSSIIPKEERGMGKEEGKGMGKEEEQGEIRGKEE